MSDRITAVRVLNPGAARAPVLKLAEPLSFWGGFDPRDGRILDRSHPQAGQSIAGTVLMLPGSRGSAGTPGGVAESLRAGVGPAGIVLLSDDVNITIGAQVADRLYGFATPVITVSADDYAVLQTGATVTITPEGVVSFAETHQ